ncbi:MAG: leader peptidase (prepilin peptidase) / N-methyltransferase [Rubrobacteraceae bacterium]|nr:leader peptidase (prepilin peptidase) / N-methyltransferase [Rubrobacteraceae bacterium]
MIPFVVGLFGLVMGSFLNVVIHRVPLRQSIIWPSSRCLSCGTDIPAHDNIPVLSYLILRGRCRNCKARISPRYPVVEVLTGLLFGLAAYEFGLSLALVSALVLISVLVVLAGTDLEHRLLPNVVVGPAAVVGFALSVAGDPGRWWVYLVSAVGVAAGLFALALAYPGGMGMGDVKMGGMLGAFLGLYAALAVFVGAVVGAIIGGILIATSRIQRQSALPFGVFLALGGGLTLFAGQEVWDWYLRLIGGV